MQNKEQNIPTGDENLRWSETLRKWVRKTGALPPKEAYKLHPAYDDLIDLLMFHKASWEGAWEGEALEICRSFIQVGSGYVCLGGDRDTHLQERAEFIVYWRDNPRTRPSKWRENARLRALVAELLDTNEPSDPHVWTVWRALAFANYVPHESQLVRDVSWTR